MTCTVLGMALGTTAVNFTFLGAVPGGMQDLSSPTGN